MTEISYKIFMFLFLFLLLQLYAMPVFDMLETLLVKQLHFKPSTTLRFITRNLYVGKKTPTKSYCELRIVFTREG